MIRLGLPDETLEHDEIFGDMLVSLDHNPGYNSIVTIIWDTVLNSGDKKVLTTVLSIEYDKHLLPKRHRARWLFELLAQPRPYTNYTMKGTTDDLMTAQALAFDQIATIRKLQSHDPTPRRPAPEHGVAGEAIHHAP